jgi:hypothetical protein
MIPLEEVHEERQDRSSNETSGDCTLPSENGNENHELGTGSLYIRESYQQLRGLSLRGRWFHIIVVNVHAPTEDKTEVKNSLYEKFERVFDKFPTYT